MALDHNCYIFFNRVLLRNSRIKKSFHSIKTKRLSQVYEGEAILSHCIICSSLLNKMEFVILGYSLGSTSSIMFRRYGFHRRSSNTLISGNIWYNTSRHNRRSRKYIEMCKENSWKVLNLRSSWYYFHIYTMFTLNIRLRPQLFYKTVLLLINESFYLVYVAVWICN